MGHFRDLLNGRIGIMPSCWRGNVSAHGYLHRGASMAMAHADATLLSYKVPGTQVTAVRLVRAREHMPGSDNWSSR